MSILNSLCYAEIITTSLPPELNDGVEFGYKNNSKLTSFYQVIIPMTLNIFEMLLDLSEKHVFVGFLMNL